MTTTVWGATASAWQHFSDTLGLTRDLLPVVADPNAPISENSKMKDKGKTPSTFNRDRKVVGIPEWTKHEATPTQVKRWATDPDLGICVQTRRMRAIDVDVVSKAQAGEVLRTIDAFLFTEEHDVTCPALRTRSNSTKFLLPIWLDGTYPKRIIRTAHGIIEFLGNGQQFIAVSTHPSGQRYEWNDGEVPKAPNIPRLTPDQFERLWAQLQERFGIAPGIEARRGGAQPKRPRALDDARDALLGYLEDKGWVVDYQGDGRVDVRCPWETEHTTDSGSSSTTYFPAGVGGFEQGHFKCLHAHCMHRTDGDFYEAVGWNTADFPLMLTQAEHDEMAAAGTLPTAESGVAVQVVTPDEVTVATDLPKFKRDGRTGKIKAIIENLVAALGEPRVSGWHMGFDAFTDTVMLAPADVDADGNTVHVPVHARQWLPITEARRGELRLHLERGAAGFEPIGKENLRDAMHIVAERHRFDSAIEWLRHRVPQWDGVKRIDNFFPRYFGAERTSYHRAVGAYTWTALAGRVLDPGCKADMVPLLIGEGGSGKTTGVAAMAPSVETSAEISLAVRDEDLSRKLRGVLVGEIGELRGLATRDRESILAWITRTHEVWTPKFQEYGTRFARRCVFIGTTNKEQGLVDDEAGLRRWLPLHVGKTDLDALEADREQLWAEARERWLAGGVEWAEANRLARAARAAATEQDPWQEPVRRWLLENDFGDGDEPGMPRFMLPFTIGMVASGALGLNAKSCNRAEQNRIGGVLRALGCNRQSVRVEGHVVQGWRGDKSAILCELHEERQDAPAAHDDLL